MCCLSGPNSCMCCMCLWLVLVLTLCSFVCLVQHQWWTHRGVSHWPRPWRLAPRQYLLAPPSPQWLTRKVQLHHIPPKQPTHLTPPKQPTHLHPLPQSHWLWPVPLPQPPLTRERVFLWPPLMTKTPARGKSSRGGGPTRSSPYDLPPPNMESRWGTTLPAPHLPHHK